jgi:hypothetical protein
MLKNWLLRHGDHSGRLRNAMATWVDWLSNGSPPYAAYPAVNTVRTVALDKSPGVRPLGIGESCMRLWSAATPRQRWWPPMHAGTPSCVLAFGLALRPTCMPSEPSGHSRQGGLRTRV